MNPSILACRKLDKKRFNGYTIKVEVPLKFEEIRGTIEGLMEKHKPAAAISTGQGGGSWLNLERVAINVADVMKGSYNCGAKPRDTKLVEGGPAVYLTDLSIRRLLDKLRASGVMRRYPTRRALSVAIRYFTTSWTTPLGRS